MRRQFPTDKFGILAPLLNLMEDGLRLWLRTYFKLFHATRWTGMHQIPDDGACIVASNHTSFYDPALIGTPICRRMRFMAYYKFFGIPGIGMLMRFVGAFPVDTARADKSAYVNTLKVLKDDEDLVVIFPEGGRTRSGAINPIKPGAARLALNGGAVIVPAVAVGPETSWPHFVCVPRLFHKFHVKYYPPIKLEKPESKQELNQAIEKINAHIMTHWRRRVRAYRRLRQRRGLPLWYSA